MCCLEMHNSPAVALFGTIFNEKHNMDNIDADIRENSTLDCVILSIVKGFYCIERQKLMHKHLSSHILIFGSHPNCILVGYTMQ